MCRIGFDNASMPLMAFALEPLVMPSPCFAPTVCLSLIKNTKLFYPRYGAHAPVWPGRKPEVRHEQRFAAAVSEG